MPETKPKPHKEGETPKCCMCGSTDIFCRIAVGASVKPGQKSSGKSELWLYCECCAPPEHGD